MDILTQTITLGGIITVGMFILGILNYNLNKKKANKEDSEEERKKAESQVKKAEEQAQKEIANEVRLISIEKDTQYIRAFLVKAEQKLDKYDDRLDNHETRITKLEDKCKRHSTKSKSTTA